MVKMLEASYNEPSMKNGGERINSRTIQVIRFAGLLLPVILTLYGLLIQANFADSSRYSGDGVFFLISILWVAVAVLQFLSIPRMTMWSIIRLSLYHLFAVSYLLFVSGFASPFIFAWVMLFLASYLYLGNRGLQFSTMTFIGVGLADIFLFKNSPETTILSLLYMMSVLIVGLVTISVSRTQEIDRSELVRSRLGETVARDRTLTIVNNLTDAILSTDHEGMISLFNAASLNLIDTNINLNGQHIDSVLRLKDLKGNDVRLFSVSKDAKSTVVRDDLMMEISDDDQIRLEITFSPIKSSYAGKRSRTGAREGYVLILRDITKLKSLEEERDEFISVVSHELRTPITIAEGTISNVTMMMGRGDVPNDKLVDSLSVAHEQVIYLSKMVNDLSTLSRAERGLADQVESIHIGEMIHELFNEYSPQAEKKGLRFDLDMAVSSEHVTASRLYLQELLQNFITNAIKYTKEGNIKLIVKQKDGKVTFAVKDTGIGISKNEQEKVFEKFYRSEDYRTRETGGTGLGLYVAAKLARKIGTNIELASRLNHGSTFSVTLPLEK